MNKEKRTRLFVILFYSHPQLCSHYMGSINYPDLDTALSLPAFSDRTMRDNAYTVEVRSKNLAFCASKKLTDNKFGHILNIETKRGYRAKASSAVALPPSRHINLCAQTHSGLILSDDCFLFRIDLDRSGT